MTHKADIDRLSVEFRQDQSGTLVTVVCLHGATPAIFARRFGSYSAAIEFVQKSIAAGLGWQGIRQNRRAPS